MQPAAGRSRELGGCGGVGLWQYTPLARRANPGSPRRWCARPALNLCLRAIQSSFEHPSTCKATVETRPAPAPRGPTVQVQKEDCQVTSVELVPS